MIKRQKSFCCKSQISDCILAQQHPDRCLSLTQSFLGNIQVRSIYNVNRFYPLIERNIMECLRKRKYNIRMEPQGFENLPQGFENFKFPPQIDGSRIYPRYFRLRKHSTVITNQRNISIR